MPEQTEGRSSLAKLFCTEKKLFDDGNDVIIVLVKAFQKMILIWPDRGEHLAKTFLAEMAHFDSGKWVTKTCKLERDSQMLG